MTEINKAIKVNNIYTNIIDDNTGESVNYIEIQNWYDNTPMDDTKVDGIIYRKKDSIYYKKIINIYDNVLVIQNMAQMKNISLENILLLRYGIVKCVRLLGYYSAFDTPFPIDYYWNDNSVATEDLASIIKVIGFETGRLMHTFRDFTDPKHFGAKGDSVTDDTVAIQAALDYPNAVPVKFSKGLYKVTSQGDAVFTLTINKDIIGIGRNSEIRADNCGANTDLFKIAISNNGGYLDVRNWRFENIHSFFNVGGRHGMYIVGSLALYNARIINCKITRGSGDSINVYRQLGHSLIQNCTLDRVYMDCWDANVIDKCSFSGTGIAITYYLDEGVRNNAVTNCTIVNRDGAIKIQRGANIRILNNQCELAQGYSPSTNQNPHGAMIWLDGTLNDGETNSKSSIYNTIIEGNNFGGGVNYKTSIYLDRATQTIISKNNFIAPDVSDIEFTENAARNIVKRDNYVVGTILDPRTGTMIKLYIIDAGVGNIGVMQSGTKIIGNETGVTGFPNFWKDENGFVHFTGSLNGGTTAVGGVIGYLPIGFRPHAKRIINVYDGGSTAVGSLFIDVDGKITIRTIPTNWITAIDPFAAELMY